MDQVKFFKGCLPQILLGAFLNTLSHLLIFLYHELSQPYSGWAFCTSFLDWRTKLTSDCEKLESGNFERGLKSIAFLNYEKFSDVNSAYSDLVNKITQVINNLAPYKTIRAKNQSNEWFDGELAEQISNRDKLFKEFKKSKFHIEELIYKEAKKHSATSN